MLNNCLNCDQELLREAKHCSNCGQKVALQNLSVWSIVSDFFSNLFNIEAKIWRTFRDIWKPAMLTTAYIAGKRVMYYNPIRIFIIALFTFFALYVFSIKDIFKAIDDTFKIKKHEVWRESLSEEYDSLSLKYNWPEEINEKIQKELLKEESVDGERMQIEVDPDSIRYEELKTDKQESEKIDTNVSSNRTTKIGLEFTTKDSLATINLDDGEIFYGISLNKFFRYSDEELLEQIPDDSWLKKLAALQIKKVVANFSSMLQFLIGNGTWLIIVLILLTSAFSKLLYVRNNYLYAEHFIFHVYGHTRLLILAILGLLLEILLLNTKIWLIPWFLIGLVYLFLGMKKFYKQSAVKTTIKFILTTIVYLWLISFCLLGVLGLSFFFF